MITLKTLPQATAQEVFDQVAKHLLIQMKQSTGPQGGCYYLNSEGLKCAAGCLIGDDEYHNGMESGTRSSLITHGKVPAFHESLICGLQVTHDSYTPSKWREQLRRLAKNYDLNTDVLSEKICQ
jgi:hypothetical protein